jgi:CHASE2 domain-containing sensor protein
MHQFLQIPIYTPKFCKPILILRFTWLIVILAAFVGSYQSVAKLAVGLMVISSVVGVTVGLRAWQRGYRPARYYLLAWPVLLIGILIYCLALFTALVPLSEEA